MSAENGGDRLDVTIVPRNELNYQMQVIGTEGANRVATRNAELCSA